MQIAIATAIKSLEGDFSLSPYDLYINFMLSSCTYSQSVIA